MMLYYYVNKKRPTLFIGLFLLTVGLENLSLFIEETKIIEIYPELKSLPFNFLFLTLPLFYLYIKEISILDTKKINYGILLPGLLELILGIILFFQSYETKERIEDSTFYIIYLVIGYFFILSVGIKIILWLKKHLCKVKEQYSSIIHKQLRWSRIFIILLLIYLLIAPIAVFFFEENLIMNVFLEIYDLVLVYWIVVQVIQQEPVLSIITEEVKEEEIVKIESTKEFETLVNEVTEYIHLSRIFTNTDLTIVDIGNALDIHPKRISNAINSTLEKNFNKYINSFRIENAKSLLKNANINLSVEGIGMESGFKSKSAFYNAFKKEVGMTPAKYRDQ